MFFAFSIREVHDDAKYIQEQYFPDYQLTEFKITKVTRLNQQYLILSLCSYRSYDTKERQKLETKVKQAAMVCSKPIYIFREIMHYLSVERIVAPMYSSLQNTIGKALKDEQNRLISIARTHRQISNH
jgi:competence transcription factor ComK